jgi:hypothetical protein
VGYDYDPHRISDPGLSDAERTGVTDARRSTQRALSNEASWEAQRMIARKYKRNNGRKTTRRSRR